MSRITKAAARMRGMFAQLSAAAQLARVTVRLFGGAAKSAYAFNQQVRAASIPRRPFMFHLGEEMARMTAEQVLDVIDLNVRMVGLRPRRIAMKAVDVGQLAIVVFVANGTCALSDMPEFEPGLTEQVRRIVPASLRTELSVHTDPEAYRAAETVLILRGAPGGLVERDWADA